MRWFHSYIIFAGSFTLFLCSRIILDVVGINSLNETSLYIYYTIKDSVICQSLFLLIISFLSVNIGFYLVADFRSHMFIIDDEKKNFNDISLKKLVVILLIICLPGTFLKLWHDFMFVRANGYLALYSDFESAPLLFRLSWMAFNIIFPVILLFYKEKRTVMLWLIIMLILSFSDALKGARSSFISPLVFFGWFYYKFYSLNDLKIKNVIIIFALFLIISELFILYRSGISFDNFGKENLLAIFLYQQGVSFTLLPIYIDYQNDIINPSNFYILYPLVNLFQRFFDPVFRGGHSLERVQSTLSIDDKIMYTINPDAYLNGSGIGSSYILETYALGGILSVIIFSMILGFIIAKMEKILANKKYIWLSWIWIPHLAWMSRGAYFPSLLMFILTLSSVKLLKGLLKRR
jgi:oligosaccharide repeat unit polymerase